MSFTYKCEYEEKIKKCLEAIEEVNCLLKCNEVRDLKVELKRECTSNSSYSKFSLSLEFEYKQCD